MKYVVIGAGAIGGTIAVRLHEAGRGVELVARGEHLAVMQTQGLRLDEPDRSRRVRLPAVRRVREVDWRPDDVALLCTKSQDSSAVLKELRDVAGHVPVVCVQNGVANERVAAARFRQVQGVCVLMPTEHLEPGHVLAYSALVPGLLDVGVYPCGVDLLSERIATDFSAAGFSSHTDAAIMRWKYSKLLGNLGNAAEAACGGDDPELPSLYKAARAEGERCLAAAGIGYVLPEEERARRDGLISPQLVDGRARGGGSTWQSLRRGAGSVEADFINGEIGALGQQHHVPTPVNDLLVTIANAMARGDEQPGGMSAAALLVEGRRAGSGDR